MTHVPDTELFDLARVYRAAFQACGFYNMWMANAFERTGGQCFYIMRRPMLLPLAEHITNSPNGAGGRRPPAPFGEAAPIMCSGSIKGIGLCIL